MKKIAILLFALISINSFSQTEEGKICLGANSNFNFSSSKTDYEQHTGTSSSSGKDLNKFNNFNLNGEFGYFAITNLAAGLNVNFTRTKLENEDAKNIYLTSPFLKYYFSLNKIKPFLRISYGFGKIKDNLVISTTSDPSSFQVNKFDTKIKELNAGTGVAYFINNNVSIELIFNYSKTTFTTDSVDVKTIQTDTLFQSRLGFSIFL